MESSKAKRIGGQCGRYDPIHEDDVRIDCFSGPAAIAPNADLFLLPEVLADD
jgi:hypothetical protein